MSRRWMIALCLGALCACATPAEEAERLLTQQESKLGDFQVEMEDQHRTWLRQSGPRTPAQDSLLAAHQDCIARHNQLVAELVRLRTQMTDSAVPAEELVEGVRSLRSEHIQLRREAQQIVQAWPKRPRARD